MIQFSCFACRWLPDVKMHLPQLILAPGFSALRVYALSDTRYIIAGLVFVLNLVPLATNMVCTLPWQPSTKLTTIEQFSYATFKIVVNLEVCSEVFSTSSGVELLYVYTQPNYPLTCLDDLPV